MVIFDPWQIDPSTTIYQWSLHVLIKSHMWDWISTTPINPLFSCTCQAFSREQIATQQCFSAWHGHVLYLLRCPCNISVFKRGRITACVACWIVNYLVWPEQLLLSGASNSPCTDVVGFSAIWLETCLRGSEFGAKCVRSSWLVKTTRYGGFLKWRYPIAGDFTIRNSYEHGWFGGTPILANLHIWMNFNKSRSWAIVGSLPQSNPIIPGPRYPRFCWSNVRVTHQQPMKNHLPMVVH